MERKEDTSGLTPCGERRAPSSSRVYLMKSFLSTRMRMVARKPVSSSTVTHELMMLNQWICARRCHSSAVGVFQSVIGKVF